jgi:hypothetical protein
MTSNGRNELIKEVEFFMRKKLTKFNKDDDKIKRIRGFPDYWIAYVGVVFTKAGTAFKKVDMSNKNGPQVELVKDGIPILKFIHDLVALTFLERPTELKAAKDDELEAYYIDEDYPVKACASNLVLRLKAEANKSVDDDYEIITLDINDSELITFDDAMMVMVN